MNNIKFYRVVTSPRKHFNNCVKFSNGNQASIKRYAVRSSTEEARKKKIFNEAYPAIIDNLLTKSRLSNIPEVRDWVKKLLDYNITRGKQTRALMIMTGYEMLEKPENVTEENRELAKVLGWCAEMMQGFFCVVDDIMDNSTMRRGVLSWYRMPNVGMGAVNDTILLSHCITETLELYFSNKLQRLKLIMLFHKTILFSSMGQHMDFEIELRKRKDYSHFTYERFMTIAQYKTGFMTFTLPVQLALALVKDVDEQMHADVDSICRKLTELYQIQDDYIDCYIDESLSGKIGTDIQEGKCTWLAVKTLQLGNNEQRDRFTKHYGNNNLDDVTCIKSLYNELNLPKLFKQIETEIYNNIIKDISKLPTERGPKLFYEITDRLYNRTR